MSLKRFAMLMISCAVFYGFAGSTASAEESITNKQAVEQQAAGEDQSGESQDIAGESQNTDQENTDKMNADSPAPVVTTAPAQKGNDKSTPSKKNKAAKKTKKKKSSKKSYTKKELRLMASIINCEAGGESYQGKLAVGIVVMNRVRSSSFPNTVKKVIYQKGQFSPVRNGSLKKRLRQYDRGKTKSSQWRSCISAAKKTLSGQKTIVYKGKVKNMKSYKFFSVKLRGARMRLGGHRFK